MCSPEAYFAAAVGNMFLAKSEMKSQTAFAEAAAREKREELKDESMQLALETVEKQNLLKEQFARDLATNRALLASNKIKQKTDLRNVNLDYLAGRRDLSYQSSDIRTQLQSQKAVARNKFYGTVLESTMVASQAAQGFKEKDGTERDK